MNEEVYSERIKKMLAKMENSKLDLMIVYSDVWRPGNVSYLTNWRQGGGGVSQAWTMLILSLRKEPILVVGFELVGAAENMVKGIKRVEPSTRLPQILKDLYNEIHPSNVALIGENIIPYNIYKQIASELNVSELIDTTPYLTELRRIKTVDELEGMKKSFEITDSALREIMRSIREGVTESELYSIGASAIHRKGGYLAFYPTVATGENSAHPMQMPTLKKVQDGDLVMLDFGTIHDGFYSDVTRTIGYKLSDNSKKLMLNTVILATNEAVKKVRPGIEMCEIEMIVRQVIRDNGFGDFIVHNVGHGIGLDQEEDFPIGPDCHIVLQPGMTFTIEPGIYIPDIGGCRIEEPVVVTDNGCEVFSKVEKDWLISI